MGTAVTTKPGKPPAGAGRNGGGWDRGGPRRRPPRDNSRLGMSLALAAIGMLFIALTSAYVVRHGLDPDWLSIRMPRLLLLNTGVLLASSVTLAMARRRNSARWMTATLLLGVLFLCGQLAAWRELSSEGIYLSSTPHSSFFYLLTGLHGLHLLGGLLALAFARIAAHRWLGAAALYWHSMDALWVYLMVLLFGWR